ncbi:MAG: RNA polymerase sigma factor [Desulfitobacteriia bacterium]|jgi:RNA polymerase sigma factor (sigma-70 family)
MQKKDMEQIYKVYAKQVYKYLFSLSQNEQLAEELTQETFYRALKSYHTYNGTCKIYVWLCQIGKHLWYQTLAKNKRAQLTELSPEIPAVEHSLEDKLILSAGKMDLFKKLHLLPEPMREVMYLRLTGEFSFREIGEILGRDENWARVTFYRGKQKIMKGRVL